LDRPSPNKVFRCELKIISQGEPRKLGIALALRMRRANEQTFAEIEGGPHMLRSHTNDCAAHFARHGRRTKIGMAVEFEA
jgi:hypothetical protein